MLALLKLFILVSKYYTDILLFMSKTIYLFSALDIQQNRVSLARYEGKVVLIVNTASQCGFTKQYAGLQELYEKYKDQDFVILGFPCNQFANQEPGTETEISNFCRSNYGVTFPLFAKINVNGADAHPLYKFLTETAPGFLGTKAIKWNFTKFLINKEGMVVKRFSPSTLPEKLVPEIEALL